MNTAEYLIRVKNSVMELEKALSQGANAESSPLMAQLESAVMELRKAHQYELAAPIYQAMGA